MRVRLLTFASASDAVGESELELEVDGQPTVGELKAELERRYPALGALWHRLAVAIDGEIAADGALLEEGCEVALLPPVSGGSSDSLERITLVALVDGPIDLAAVVRTVERPDCGAVLVFAGNVRDHHAGRPVERITYHAYRPMAERRLRRIVAELEAAEPGLALAITHRLGPIAVGATSVVIAAASPHREVCYRANRIALERLKAEVPIWKQEHYRGGEAAWREEESLLSRG